MIDARLLRTGALGVLLVGLGVACGGNANPEPKKVPAADRPAPAANADAKVAPGPTVDPHGKTATANPHGSVASMEAPKMASKVTPGKFEFEIDATPIQLPHIPFVSNSAVWIPAKKTGRLTLAAAESEKSVPMLSIVLLGPKLDELKFPAEFTPKQAKEGKGPDLRVTWRVNDKRVYRSYLGEDFGDAKLILTGFDDGKVTGELAATVRLANESLGAPLKVTGNFEVEVRASGMSARKTADEKAADAAKGKGKGKGKGKPKPDANAAGDAKTGK